MNICSLTLFNLIVVHFVVLQGTRVSGEDVIIGKTTPLSQEEAQGQAARYSRRDHSISLRHSENGIVDQVLFKNNTSFILKLLSQCFLYHYVTCN